MLNRVTTLVITSLVTITMDALRPIITKNVRNFTQNPQDTIAVVKHSIFDILNNVYIGIEYVSNMINQSITNNTEENMTITE